MTSIRRELATRLVRFALPLALVAIAVVLSLVTRWFDSYARSPYPLVATRPFHAELARLSVGRSGASRALAAHDFAIEHSFKPGETLGQVLDELGLSSRESWEVSQEAAKHVDLRRLRPRDTYAVLLDDDSRIRSVRLTLAGKGRAEVLRQGDTWRGSWHRFTEERIVRSIRGELRDSLEGSIQRAGAEAMLAYLMADVLQWDLDFTRDLRQGDRFEILFEEILLDGAYESLGEILGLAYDNRGERLEAYRFGEEAGYYDAEGRPLRKMFLRSPLRFSRVTSRFSHRRFHPILKRYRPHLGVDYGAPVGTPVRVTGNGVVEFAGRDGSGGKTIRVRHPNQYKTAYLHLSRFASGIRSGRRVSQGEVIGYVGSTGLATAPHLDYRIQHRGRWINPLSLKSQPADPIPGDRLPQFLAWRDHLRDRLAGEPTLIPAAPSGELLAAVGSVEPPIPPTSGR